MVYDKPKEHLTRIPLCSWHGLWTATKSTERYSRTRKQTEQVADGITTNAIHAMRYRLVHDKYSLSQPSRQISPIDGLATPVYYQTGDLTESIGLVGRQVDRRTEPQD